MADPGSTPRRKSEHLRVNLEEDVSSSVPTGLDNWRFIPRALPEIDLSDVSGSPG